MDFITIAQGHAKEVSILITALIERCDQYKVNTKGAQELRGNVQEFLALLDRVDQPKTKEDFKKQVEAVGEWLETIKLYLQKLSNKSNSYLCIWGNDVMGELGQLNTGLNKAKLDLGISLTQKDVESLGQQVEKTRVLNDQVKKMKADTDLLNKKMTQQGIDIRNVLVTSKDELHKKLVQLTNNKVSEQTTNPHTIHEIPFEELKTTAILNHAGEANGKEVFAATYKGAPVAVKMMSSGKNMPEEGLVEFRKEIRLATGIGMKNVVQVFGACTKSNTQMAIVMELLQGNLATLLKKSLSWPRKVRIAKEIADGLSFLHNNQIIHRNLTTANILYDEDEHVKISGFGVAKYFFDPKTHKTGTRPKGTSAYLAPELWVIRNPPYSYQSDIYAFGIVLLEIAAQKPPREGIREEQIANLLLENNRDPIPDDVPRDYATLITECWEGDPKLRPKIDDIKNRLANMVVPGSPSASK